MKIYIAHPINGLTPEVVFDYYDQMKKTLWQHTVLSPMTGKDDLRCEVELRAEGYFHPTATNHAIFERDMWMVSQADVVLVDLLETPRCPIGCCMELAVASWLRKHTILVMAKDSEYRHAFLLEAADIVFETIDEAIKYFQELRE
jgi:nucleoside 2-deoxyribosyltransferase